VFKSIQVGIPITGWSADNVDYTNYTVVGKGAKWAVLQSEGGDVFQYVLEPTDNYLVGRHEVTEATGSLEFQPDTDGVRVR
jgi:hypothetical protein